MCFGRSWWFEEFWRSSSGCYLLWFWSSLHGTIGLRNCWVLPLFFATIFPADFRGRATVACATFAGEIAIAMAESSLHLANATGSAKSERTSFLFWQMQYLLKVSLLQMFALPFRGLLVPPKSSSFLSPGNTPPRGNCLLLFERNHHERCKLPEFNRF